MSNSLLVVSGKDVDAITSDLDLKKALASQAAVFEAYSNPSIGNQVPAIQTPQRLVVQSDKATTLVMPARVAGTGTACKIVSVPKGGSTSGLPATTLVLDEEGKVRGIVNARKLTALRNACGRFNHKRDGAWLIASLRVIPAGLFR